MNRELIAAIDLGSNSFRLQIGRIVNDQIYPLDGIKEAVRLAAGLSPERMLDAAAQFRGISALRCFNERIRDYPLDAVRAVATNTLRVAKNAPHFLVQAEAALVPPVKVTTVEARKKMPGFRTRPGLDCRPVAMAKDWKSARMTVR